MNNLSEILVLSNEPLPETETTVTLGILSEEEGGIRGTKLPQKKELEGKITFNPDRCLIFAVPPSTDSTVVQTITPDRAQWDLYLIIIPFTLHKAPGERYYEEMTFFIEMADRKVTAFDLFPKQVTTKVEETRTYTLSPYLKVCPVEAGMGQSGIEIRFTSLHPTITAFGEGEHIFYWVYGGFQEQEEVIPETKHALIVMQVPRGTPSVTATISYETVIVKKLLGVWRYKDGATAACPVQWDLNKAVPFYVTNGDNALVEPAQRLQTTTISANNPFDVCIICALSEEARAFIEETSKQCGVQFDRAFDKQLDFEYYHAYIPNNRGELLKLQVSSLPAYGPVETSLHLKPLLKKFRPRFAAMTGICAGNKKKVKLGDLVVAERAYFYDSGKFITDQHGKRVQLHNADVYHVSSKIKGFIQMFEQWNSAVTLLEPACHMGTLASGSAVRGDDPFDEGQLPVRNTLAIDMEGAAFYRTIADFPGMHTLLVKGVSDYADGNKDDLYHWRASALAAIYMLAFIQEYVTAESMPRANTY